MKILLVKDYNPTSFGLQASILERGLKELGHTVDTREKNSATKDNIPPGYDVYLYYTIYNTNLFWNGIPRHGKNVIFEVADTDAISHAVLYFLRNQPIDAVVVPSNFSKSAYYVFDPKPRQPIHVIPHALDPHFYVEEWKPLPSNYEHPLLTVTVPHSLERKGGDIAFYVIRELMRAGYHFHHMIEINNPLESRVRGLNFTPRKLTPDEHYTLFSQTDVLLYPVRGGAFEIPILENLAFHADVVIPDQGPWTEYVDKEDAFWIHVKGQKKYWFTNPFHVGNFFEPDPEDTYAQTLLALSMQSEERDKMKVERAKKYREKFHYLRIAKEWEKLLSSL